MGRRMLVRWLGVLVAVTDQFLGESYVGRSGR